MSTRLFPVCVTGYLTYRAITHYYYYHRRHVRNEVTVHGTFITL